MPDARLVCPVCHEEKQLRRSHLRTVDPDSLGGVGHFLPAMFFAINIGDPTPDTISTDLTLATRSRPIIVDPPLPPIGPVNPPITEES